MCDRESWKQQRIKAWDSLPACSRAPVSDLWPRVFPRVLWPVRGIVGSPDRSGTRTLILEKVSESRRVLWHFGCTVGERRAAKQWLLYSSSPWHWIMVHCVKQLFELEPFQMDVCFRSSPVLTRPSRSSAGCPLRRFSTGAATFGRCVFLHRPPGGLPSCTDTD